jgi:hypothetical protein
VAPGNIFSDLSPQARVFTAILPFGLALFARLILGNNQLTRWLLSLGVVWFAANILMAPYSVGIRQGIRSLRTLLP